MKRLKSILSIAVALALCFTFFVGCSNGKKEISDDEVALAETIDLENAEGSSSLEDLQSAVDDMSVEGMDSEVMAMNLDALSEAPAVPVLLMAVASGTTVLGNSAAEIDASNTADGYTMVRYLGSSSARLKVLITGPSGTTYNYNLTTSGEYEVFPLSDGSGAYKIVVYQHVVDSKYSILYTANIDVSLKDEFAPFLLPNQYVNYSANSLCVKQAAALVGSETDILKIINVLYSYVVKNFTYDSYLAQTVQSGYLPDLDNVYNKQSGICFDYAALLTAMLRSQNIPTKLVVGNAGSSYHAWINVYSQESGWMDAAIFFDGNQWKLMDPTFASSANSADYIMKYIGDGSNYTSMYLY